TTAGSSAWSPRPTSPGACRRTSSPSSSTGSTPRGETRRRTSGAHPHRPGPSRPGRCRSRAVAAHVRGDLGGGLRAVRLGEPLEELLLAQLVLLPAHVLEHVRRGEVADLGAPL